MACVYHARIMTTPMGRPTSALALTLLSQSEKPPTLLEGGYIYNRLPPLYKSGAG